MATSNKAYLLSLSLSLLLLFNVSLAQFGEPGRSPFGSQRRFGSQSSRCRIERLNAQEPRRRVESEAGLTEYFDEDNEQFECAGVAAHRRVIQPRGLVVPKFYNAHALTYIVRGKGIFGSVMPGCPESFQSFQRGEPRTLRQEGRGGSKRDQHQRVDHFREGDVIAIPAGVAHWVYNDGEQPIVAFTVLDTSNNANQLDNNRREFLLAGRKGRGQHFSVEPSHREDSDDNLLRGFETETLAESMGISRDLAEKVRGRNDDRGEIVRVEAGSFHIVRPSRREEGSEEEEGEREFEEEERERERRLMANGLEQAFCSVRVKHNIDDPRRADIYNPNAGRTTTLNSQKLPLLRYLQLNAVRGVLHRNAFVAPHWNMNAHSIMYVTRGNARLQIVDHRGNTAFNGELRQNQLIVVPEYFALLIQSRSENFEWVAIKTNDNAIVSPIVGKTSVFKGLPEEVLRNAYRVSREEARRLKYSRGEEMVVFVPHSSQSRGRAEA